MFVELTEQRAVAPPLLGVTTPSATRRMVSFTEPYLYLIPALIGLGLWIYRPLFETFNYSFYNWNLLPSTPKVFVGWGNYTRLFHMPALWQAVGTSLFFLTGLLIFGLILPLIVGTVAQHISPKASKVYQGLIFLPVLVSPIVTATVWEFILSPIGGFVDTVLGWFGAPAINWLQQMNTAKFSIVLISGWKVLGVSVLVVTAGLAAIGVEYFEAASIDGASRFQIFRKITLPLLSPTLMFMFITVVLLSSQIVFPLLNAMTQGGPMGSTTDIYYFLYQYGFQSFNVGLASAAAVCFFFVFGAVALVSVRLLDRFSFYDN